MLSRFSAFRFRGDPLKPDDVVLYEGYKEFLATRNMLDFDTLVLKAAQLLADESVAAQVRQRWSAVLVDEFQDLNPSQYRIIRALASEHKNVFAVGDDEQSIYSWTGADPSVFRDFANDFKVDTKAQLGENWRCPRQVVDLARRLVANNTPIFQDRRNAETSHESPFEVTALTFPTEDSELRWIIEDIRRDRNEHQLAWGEFALLYRKHEIGDTAESGFLTAGIPCRLANKRALAEDPVVCYVIAALRVIASPNDEIHKEAFLKVVLPSVLFDSAQAKAEEKRLTLLPYLEEMVRTLPKEHEDARKIWRSFYALRNLAALGARHTRIDELVEELLSQRVGEYRTRLDPVHPREILEPGTPCVQLVREHERIVGDEIRPALPRQRCAHPAKNRKVEAVAVVGNAHVAAAELPERRPDFLEEGRRGECLRVEPVLLQGSLGDGDSWLDERLEPVGDPAVAHAYGRDLHDLRARSVAVGRLEINCREIPKVIGERAASHVLHCLEDSYRNAERGRLGKRDSQRVLWSSATKEHVPKSGAGKNSLERDLHAAEGWNPQWASAV